MVSGIESSASLFTSHMVVYSRARKQPPSKLLRPCSSPEESAHVWVYLHTTHDDYDLVSGCLSFTFIIMSSTGTEVTCEDSLASRIQSANERREISSTHIVDAPALPLLRIPNGLVLCGSRIIIWPSIKPKLGPFKSSRNDGQSNFEFHHGKIRSDTRAWASLERPITSNRKSGDVSWMR